MTVNKSQLTYYEKKKPIKCRIFPPIYVYIYRTGFCLENPRYIIHPCNIISFIMYSQLRTNKDGFLCTWRTSCIAPYRWLKYNLHNNITLVHWDEKIMYNANWFWKLPLKVLHVKASFMFHGPVHACRNIHVMHLNM